MLKFMIVFETVKIGIVSDVDR